MVSLPFITWIRFVIWLLIGITLYFVYGMHHSQLGRRIFEEEKKISEEEVAEVSQKPRRAG
jgi:APA family basic amino acid/polyamine antiporter